MTRSFDVFLSGPQQTVEHTTETPVSWDAIALIMTSLYCGAERATSHYLNQVFDAYVSNGFNGVWISWLFVWVV